MDHKFQINLRGLIDLLSNHLYSGPEVFVRELLQNGGDAIRARAQLEPGHQGLITLELHTPRGKPPSLVVSDDGVGLTPDEVHRFLATIGESSKRALDGTPITDFIGQFGIGILACFVVSDEIVVISRSARGGSPTVEWRGRPDGTYTLKNLDSDLAPGTQVFLTGKREHADLFTFDRISQLARHYGGLLPFPIRVVAGKASSVVNEGGAPWRRKFADDRRRSRALLAFGREAFGGDFLDAIPLRSSAGEVDGVAFVLPHTVNLAAPRTHRVYLKNMLLSENADNLLPNWAFFVKAVVNANDLRPTASRESFYEDAKLGEARDALGECLRRYLVQLANDDPRRLDRLIGLHGLAIKALAVEDNDFYRLFIDWLPFETTTGEMTFGEYRKEHAVVRYTLHVDSFRQIARVAAAQGLCVINGGYTYDSQLLARAPEVFPDLSTEVIEPAKLAQAFDDLDLQEQEEAHAFLQTADAVLRPFRCTAEVKKFLPRELPALFSTSAEGRFLRSLEQSQEIANPLWSGVLGSLGKGDRPSASPGQLCFNFHNPLVRRLAGVASQPLVQRSVQMLYVQALLLGHHPLSAKEMSLLNQGLLDLIDWGIDTQAKGQP